MIFFNLCKCLFIGSLIKYNLYNEKLIKILLKTIHKCGIIPVKMLQWILPPLKAMDTDKKILNIFENVYEKCPNHNIEYTEQIYKLDFYDDISTEYEILDIIGSGSIAQVYKIRDKSSDKFYAMKVKHPNVKKQFNIINYYLKIIFSIISFNKIIPVNLNDFLIQFKLQLNFVNEGNNLLKFGELYKNNKLYKIPNVYKLSKNIIIMDYIEADTIEKFSDNNIKYSKYNLEIFIFSNNNLFVNNFNHGDLHNYNWKITNDKKIVIYDFGLCWEMKDNTLINIFNELLDGFHTKDMNIVYSSFKRFIMYDSNIEEYIIKTYFNDHMKNVDRFMDISKHLLLFGTKYNITLDVNLLYIIVSWQNTLLIFMRNYNDKRDVFEINNLRSEEYNICDYYDILPEYRIFLKNQILNYNKNDDIDYDNLRKFIK
jgi:predicted unusual protein kinase regulating ubiquinone biosynthesis (AarF/ABC1/UbiB family)